MNQSEDADRVAVIIPCYNEECSIATVVGDFRRALPDAQIYVCDNNSHDRSVERARAAGAVIRREQLQGKGHVIRRMFADVDADAYIIVDGDDTYDAASAPAMVAKLFDGPYDMINARRVSSEKEAYRPAHVFGNRVITYLVGALFGRRFDDILSGYRVLSRRFVKSFPVLATGFEIETELTVHALELQMPVAEIETPYKARAEGSTSKLNTWRDGLRILRTILNLLKGERPLKFFSTLFVILAAASIALAWPVFITYLETGLVPRLPTAVLSTGLMLLAFLSFTCGLILDTVTRGRQEMKRIRYLEIPAPGRVRSKVDLATPLERARGASRAAVEAGG